MTVGAACPLQESTGDLRARPSAWRGQAEDTALPGSQAGHVATVQQSDCPEGGRELCHRAAATLTLERQGGRGPPAPVCEEGAPSP